MSASFDKQLEAYRHKKYRRRRLRFYGLIMLAVTLFAVAVGIFVITNQPIDVKYIKESDTALEVARMEYGDTYINTLDNLPTIGYESQYVALKGTYLDLLQDNGSVSDKNKIALDLVVFVEYVQQEAVSTSRKYGLTDVSKNFSEEHTTYLAENGDVYDSLIELVDSHTTTEGRLSDERLADIILDLDARIDLYTGYLTTLKNI